MNPNDLIEENFSSLNDEIRNNLIKNRIKEINLSEININGKIIEYCSTLRKIKRQNIIDK